MEIEIYCADLRPGDDSTRQAFDLWLGPLRYGKAAPFEPTRLVCRKRYPMQDPHEFTTRGQFELRRRARLEGLPTSYERRHDHNHPNALVATGETCPSQAFFSHTYFKRIKKVSKKCPSSPTGN